MNRLCFALLFVAAQGCGPARAEHNPAAVENGLRSQIAIAGEPLVTSTLSQRMAHYHVPGVAIALIDGGRVAWIKGYGMTGNGGRTVGPQTCFQVGSVSKAVTATGAMKLVEIGRLKLDSDANSTLRSWKVPPKDGETVTLRQLLSHTGGIGVHAFWPGYEPGQKLPSPVQILAGQPPATNAPIAIETPQGQWDYSGGGFQIAQQMMTDAAGKDFAPLMRSIVFAPLDMKHSTFEQSASGPPFPDCAHGHDRDGVILKTRYYMHPEMAAAGLWSTPGDLAKLLIAVGGAWQGKGNALMKPGTARAMLTRQAPNWGLGFELEGDGKSFRFGHSGDNPGYKATMFMYPASGQGAVILTNGDRGEPLAREIMLSIAAAYGWAGIEPKMKTRAPTNPADAASVAGTYELQSVPGVKLIITPAADGLNMRLIKGTNDSTTPLIPAGNRRYFRRDLDLELHFSGESPAQSVDLVQEGSTFPAKRIPN